MSSRLKRQLARKSQRGTAVLIVVMVITMLTAIGVFAVRNASQIDQAVGFSRQSAQTVSLAELGTTATIAEFGADKAGLLLAQMDKTGSEHETCLANKAYMVDAPCYRLFKSDLEASTLAAKNEPLLVSPVSGSETGSFGPSAGMYGDVYVEITEKGPTGRPLAGTELGGTSTALKFAKVTLTATGQIRPSVANNDVCNEGVAAVASKKVMRARVVVGPI